MPIVIRFFPGGSIIPAIPRASYRRKGDAEYFLTAYQKLVNTRERFTALVGGRTCSHCCYCGKVCAYVE